MTTVEATWAQDTYDLHVLRDQSTRRLDEILFLMQDPPRSPPQDPHVLASETPRPGDVVSVEFLPLFNHPPPLLGLIFAHGVVVDVENGRVGAAATPPATAVANFIINAVVTVTDPAGGPDKELPPAKLRVHVHRSVADMWITPDPFGIRRGADGQRLSVLARFDDDTVGDLTDNHGVTWTPTPTGAAVQVDPGTGALSAGPPTAGSGPVSVRATLPPELGSLTASADVHVLDGWGSQPVDVRAATLIRGPGSAAMTRVPNVLILGDGFQATEQVLFENVADELVRLLNTSSATFPYKLLGGGINYWRAFVPSPKPGMTVLNELDLTPVATPGGPPATEGLEVPLPQAPVAASTEPFSLAELVHEVGLPIPIDRTVPDLAAIRSRWITLFPVNTARFGKTPVDAEQLFRDWRDLSDRRLADERDTAFGLASGQRPAVDRPIPSRALTYNPRRTTRAHLDQFLATLTHGRGGSPIGATWVSGTTPPGKDSSLVVVLCAGGRHAGGRTPNENDLTRTDLIASALVATGATPLDPVPASFRLTPRRIPVPLGRGGKPKVVAEAQSTAAHELAHGLGLGDEYGGFNNPLAEPKLKEIRSYLNIQLREELLIGGLLVADNVRWRWPRLLRAGKLVAAPELDGTGPGNFRLSLAPGHARSFKAGDRVRLRGPLPSRSISGELEVLPTLGAVDKVRVHDPLLVQVLLFLPGSVLCVPRAAPPSAAGDDFAELMAQKVRVHITATHGPLNAPKLTPQRPCVGERDPFSTQRANNLPAGLPARQPPFRRWIVGLFEGGGEQNCTVLHPTGSCTMRSNAVPSTDPLTGAVTTNPGVIYRFCNVCQYILVDRVDASRHKELEELVVRKKLYPQPR
jgi:hypothetical protein